MISNARETIYTFNEKTYFLNFNIILIVYIQDRLDILFYVRDVNNSIFYIYSFYFIVIWVNFFFHKICSFKNKSNNKSLISKSIIYIIYKSVW